MLAVVVYAAVGYGTAADTASPLGPWLVGGHPQEMTLSTLPMTPHPHLDALHNDFVACDKDLPWSSANSDCVLMQLVSTALQPAKAYAPSVAFLRHSRFGSLAGTPAFKSFGYTLATDEADDEFYYPLAATADHRSVLLVRAPGAVPPACRTKACLYDHMNRLDAMMDYVASKTLVNETHSDIDHPFVSTKYYFVSGSDHLPASSTEAAVTTLVAALALAAAAVGADMCLHHGQFDERPEDKIPMSSELKALVVMGVAATAITTLFVVYWDGAAEKEHSTIRSIDSSNGSHRHLPAWSYLYVGLSATSVVVAVGYSVMHRKGPRYSQYKRMVMLTASTVAVAIACALPTAYETALSSRAINTANKTLVDSALDAATQILLASYESAEDAREALDDDSYTSTARLATSFGIPIMVTFAAAAAWFNHLRDHEPHLSNASLVLAAAVLFAAVAAIVQLAMTEHFHIEDHPICTLPPEAWAYMTGLGLAAAFYVSATGVLIAGYVPSRPIDLSQPLLAPIPFLLIIAGAAGHSAGTYSHLDSHCPRLVDHHWIGTLSAVSIASVITALVLYAFATPATAEAEPEAKALTKNPVFEKPKPPPPVPENVYAEVGPAPKTTEGFFGL